MKRCSRAATSFRSRRSRIQRSRGWSIQPALYIPVYGFDSDNLRSGTGAVRARISVAAALKRPATVVDSMSAHCAQNGLCWPEANA